MSGTERRATCLSRVPGPTRPGDSDQPAPGRIPPPPRDPQSPAGTACKPHGSSPGPPQPSPQASWGPAAGCWARRRTGHHCSRLALGFLLAPMAGEGARQCGPPFQLLGRALSHPPHEGWRTLATSAGGFLPTKLCPASSQAGQSLVLLLLPMHGSPTSRPGWSTPQP